MVKGSTTLENAGTSVELEMCNGKSTIMRNSLHVRSVVDLIGTPAIVTVFTKGVPLKPDFIFLTFPNGEYLKDVGIMPISRMDQTGQKYSVTFKRTDTDHRDY